MVLPASDVLILTNNSLLKTNSDDLQLEISLAENRIRAAAGLGLYNTTYNATIIGNPQTDPRLHTDLPPNQLDFFDAFVDAGYVVTVDTATGYWAFSWSAEGAESLVQIYTFRTVFNPTAIIDDTKIAIENFFAALRPTVHSVVSYNNFIDEAGFGGTSSTFFEFTIVTDQQDPTDLSNGLRTAVIGQGLGYTINNCNVYRIASS
jgi:hypothetical protein